MDANSSSSSSSSETLDHDAVVEYARAGTSQTKSSGTQKAHGTAKKYFGTFLATKNMNTLDSLIAEENQCLADITLLQEFGTFLMEVAKDEAGKLLSWKNAQTIYGNLITPLSQLPHLNSNPTFLVGPMNNWYANARLDMKKFIVRREMLAGHELSKQKALSLGRDVITLLCSILMDENTITSESERAALAMAYSAIGRGGEVGLSSFNRFDWCMFFDTLEQNWAETKTGDCDIMNHFCDAISFEMCVFHSLSGHLMMGGPLLGAGRDGVEDEANFAFPHLARNIDNAATTVSNMMKRVAGRSTNLQLKAVASELKSTCLRVGAADTVMNHPSLNHNLIFSAMRGGWEMTHICRIFEYLNQYRIIIGCAGKALAGYENALQKVVPPCLLFLQVSLSNSTSYNFSPIYPIFPLSYIPLVLQDDPTLRPKVDVCITLLYAHSCPDLTPGRRLARLGEVLLANELMHSRECHTKHPLHTRFEILVSAVQRSNLCGENMAATQVLGKVQKWGDLIKLDWKKKNLIEQVKAANELGEHDNEICELMSRLEMDAASNHQELLRQGNYHYTEQMKVRCLPITSSKTSIF